VAQVEVTGEAASDESRMPLTDHLRELRTRIVRSVLAIVIGSVAAWFFYDQIFAAITAPVEAVVAEMAGDGRDIKLVMPGVADPFILKLQISGVAGVVLSSPIWLYQMWRFVTPGLHKHEKRWSLLFVAIATPLFVSGTLLAYLFLPNALGFLFDFTPADVSNFIDVTRYIGFFLRTTIVFGLGFLLPLVALMLNLAGVLPAQALIRAWRWVLLGIFVFAAVATPDGNPLTMTVLASPIIIMIAIVMGIAALNDRRKSKKDPLVDLRDEEISPLTEEI
jgi:sec-independent protein translocase protein TatC